MSITAEDFQIIPSDIEYDKKEISTILQESETINPETVASELVQWLINNVEQFIDNKKRIFKIDMIIDADDGQAATMPEAHKLQSLYRAIPEEPELSIGNATDLLDASKQLTEDEQKFVKKLLDCRATLDAVTSSVYSCMKSNTKMLDELFTRMSFYYEMKGVDRGNLLVEELHGEVDIVKFEYEAFNVGVKVLSPIVGESDNEEIDAVTGKSVKQYIIPEGFTLWIEIAFKTQRQKMNSMF